MAQLVWLVFVAVALFLSVRLGLGMFSQRKATAAIQSPDAPVLSEAPVAAQLDAEGASL